MKQYVQVGRGLWSVINSQVGAVLVGALFSHQLTKSYRNEEIKDIKADLVSSDEDRSELKQRNRDLVTMNRKLSNELSIARSQLNDVRFNFLNSFCFWRSDSRYAGESVNAPQVVRDSNNDRGVKP